MRNNLRKHHRRSVSLLSLSLFLASAFAVSTGASPLEDIPPDPGASINVEHSVKAPARSIGIILGGVIPSGDFRAVENREFSLGITSRVTVQEHLAAALEFLYRRNGENYSNAWAQYISTRANTQVYFQATGFLELYLHSALVNGAYVPPTGPSIIVGLGLVNKSTWLKDSLSSGVRYSVSINRTSVTRPLGFVGGGFTLPIGDRGKIAIKGGLNHAFGENYEDWLSGHISFNHTLSQPWTNYYNCPTDAWRSGKLSFGTYLAYLFPGNRFDNKVVNGVGGGLNIFYDHNGSVRGVVRGEYQSWGQKQESDTLDSDVSNISLALGLQLSIGPEVRKIDTYIEFSFGANLYSHTETGHMDRSLNFDISQTVFDLSLGLGLRHPFGERTMLDVSVRMPAIVFNEIELDRPIQTFNIAWTANSAPVYTPRDSYKLNRVSVSLGLVVTPSIVN